MASISGYSGGEQSRVEDELTFAVVLGERLRCEIEEAESFKLECAAVSKLADKILELLRYLVRILPSASQPIYDRPARRIFAETKKNLFRALKLIRKCRRRNLLSRMVNIVSTADFRKVNNHLEASVGDLIWLQNILDTSNNDDSNTPGGGVTLTLPPIAINDPTLAWVWSSITSMTMGPLVEKVDAANQLASLAKDNDRNKKIIVEEDGIPPLLRLLKLGSSQEAQIASATALYHLSDTSDRVRVIKKEGGIPIIVKVLADSPLKVQSQLAKLVARIAENDRDGQENLGKENAIRPLVTLLSFETFTEEDHWATNAVAGLNQHSLHSVVQINQEIDRNTRNSDNVHRNYNHRPVINSYASFNSEGGRGLKDRRDRENERADVKFETKVNCSEALFMLTRGNILNCKRIAETKGLLCLAKLVEKDDGKLGYNCLITLNEIAEAAETNADLRRYAFKTNSPAAKAVVNQLFRIIDQSDNSPSLLIAIRAIGSLARTFPARDTRVIKPLVTLLSHRNLEVATEAAIALEKFSCPENFLSDSHSKTIIEFNGIQPLMRLLRGNEKSQLHGLFLLCYLAMRADNEALEQARVLSTLEGIDKQLLAQHPDLRELVSKTVYHINLYHTSSHSQRFSFVLN